MTANLTNPLVFNIPKCPAEPLLRAILDKIEFLSGEVQTLKNQEAKTQSLGTISSRLHANALILGLQVEYPDRVWTSEDFAKVIGCTGSAVRKTKAWKAYQKMLEGEKDKRPQRPGWKDKNGNLVAIDVPQSD